MPTVDIEYTIVGDHSEAGARCSSICETPVTVERIKQNFAFEGEFLFRVKVSEATLFGQKDSNPNAYYWLDLQAESDAKYISTNTKKIEVHALLLSIPDSEECLVDQQYADYVEGAAETLHDLPADNEQLEYARAGHGDSSSSKGGSGSGKVSSKQFFQNVVNQANQGVQSVVQSAAQGDIQQQVQQVTKGIGSLWNSVKHVATSAASQIQQNIATMSEAGVPSDVAARHLGAFSDDLAVTFNDRDSRHVAALTALWNAMNDAAAVGAAATTGGTASRSPLPFERESPRWKETLGFQGPNPVADLKSSGLLSLRAMTYLLTHYTSAAGGMVHRNRANVKTNYPFAIVGVNMTLLLADVMKLKNRTFLSHSCAYWELFEGVSNFFEIYCSCFFHLNHLWNKGAGATRAEFGKLMAEVRHFLESILQKAPRNMAQFRQLALDAGYVPV